MGEKLADVGGELAGIDGKLDSVGRDLAMTGASITFVLRSIGLPWREDVHGYGYTPKGYVWDIGAPEAYRAADIISISYFP